MGRHTGDTRGVRHTREQKIIALRRRGASTTEIAKVVGMTPGGVSVCLKRIAPQLGKTVTVDRSEAMRRYWRNRKRVENDKKAKRYLKTLNLISEASYLASCAAIEARRLELQWRDEITRGLEEVCTKLDEIHQRIEEDA